MFKDLKKNEHNDWTDGDFSHELKTTEKNQIKNSKVILF